MSDREAVRQETATLTPFNEEEYSSLKNAMIIMVVASIIVGLLYTLNLLPFFVEFDIGVFFTPAIILLVAWLVISRRRRQDSIRPADASSTQA